MPVTVDVCVLGGGPGGYVAALRAAALGASVALVEADSVGGVCLVRGCVPSKAMLRSAEVYHLAVNAKAFGVTVSGVQADYPAIRARKDRIVGQLVRGVHGLLDEAGVTLVKGYGRLASPGVVEVDWGGAVTFSSRLRSLWQVDLPRLCLPCLAPNCQASLTVMEPSHLKKCRSELSSLGRGP